MLNRTKKFGAQDAWLRNRNVTYLAKIAFVLQAAPDKMLTFTQLMDRITPVMSEDKKLLGNNIRVCLSTHSCFVKIPVNTKALPSKRNYWKLDSSQITTKMVRRHFKGILQLFPELASKVETEERNGSSEAGSAPRSPEPAACKAVQIRCEAKFSSPFSIESLLKRDSPCDRPSRPSPLSSVQVRVEQQPRLTHGQVGTKRPQLGQSWDKEEAGSSPICSTGGSTYTPNGAAKAIKRVQMCAELSFPIYTRAAPYYSSPHSGYITYSHDPLCFRL
uniref:forkhead box protein H1-like n=1 Tax=Solea senegalensis TaxID=28829 RepID=UPI001CD882A5|nr:forkhead box protein H1-like [Solea senegalensis]